MYKKPLIQALTGTMFAKQGIKIDTLRLDLIHPQVSGNKWYKLKYYLEAATKEGKEGLLSFGGAYSNHLVAMAYACKESKLKAVGIIRGEEPRVYGPSLQQMEDLGMELVFVSREEYRNKPVKGYGQYYVVPEGGAGKPGIRGASEIMKEVEKEYSHIVCSVGTGTTLAGIVNASSQKQQIIGVSALKVSNDQDNELLNYINENTLHRNFLILFDYHFGGYAKKTNQLIRFMNELFKEENVPTDFVYTGKLFFAAHDLMHKNYFPPGSEVLIIHSGGLQGNKSQQDLIFKI
jgi:D-cysteine desulfhydrase